MILLFDELLYDIEPLTPTLNCLIKALIETDQFQIYLSGSASDFYIKPCAPCLNDLDLVCQRKDIVAEFEKGFNAHCYTTEKDDAVTKIIKLTNLNR